MIPESVPCIACGRVVAIEQVDGAFVWTYDGIWMLETGNYGSRVLDDPAGRLAVFMVLCDGCLRTRRDRLRAVEVGRDTPRPESWRWLDEIPEHLLGPVDESSQLVA